MSKSGPKSTWSVQDAKNNLSSVIDAASRGRPQTVTKHGKPAVVVVDANTFARLQGRSKNQPKNFVEHLLAMPQEDIDFPRMKIRPRDIF